MTETDADLRAVSEMAICQCLDLQPGKSLVIVTDDKRERTGKALYEVVGKVIGGATIVRYSPRNQHGEEPPVPVAAAMQARDALLVPTTESLSHTRAYGDARDAGARGTILSGTTEEVFVTGLDVDCDAIYDHGAVTLDAVGGAGELRVTTEKGADIAFIRGDHEWLIDTGVIAEAGSFLNLSVGGAFLSPASVASIYVVDGTMTSRGLLDEGRELRFEVEDGYATEISDDDIYEQVEAAAEEVGDDAYSLAEIDIDTSVGITDLAGSVLLDGKATGMVHITVGDDTDIGGDADAPLHLSGIIREPVVCADGEEVDLSQP